MSHLSASIRSTEGQRYSREGEVKKVCGECGDRNVPYTESIMMAEVCYPPVHTQTLSSCTDTTQQRWKLEQYYSWFTLNKLLLKKKAILFFLHWMKATITHLNIYVRNAVSPVAQKARNQVFSWWIFLEMVYFPLERVCLGNRNK